MRAHLLFLLAASCAVLPDEVAVNTFTNQYDYLGGGDLKGLGSEEGNSTGVGVTATYKLRPTQVQVVSAQPVRVPEVPSLQNVGKMLWDATSESVDPFGFLPRAEYSAGAAGAVALLWWVVRRSRRGKQTAEEPCCERHGKGGHGN